MPLPASGPISLSQVNIELGLVSTAQINLSDVAVRALFGAASGAIRLGGDGHGKSAAPFAAAITANQTNLNLRTFAVAAGWNQSVPATITVNAGVYVYATSTGNAGMTIDGSWPGGVTVINNGFVIGQGGNGSTGTNNGFPGGAAIALGVNCAIINNSGAFVAGGGGGGANRLGGGGAGGGASGDTGNAGGGGPGAAGGNGIVSFNTMSGAGGGRILPGVGGSRGYVNPAVASIGGGAGGGGGAFIQSPGGFFINLAAGGGGGGWGAIGGPGWVFQVSYFPTQTGGGDGGSGGNAGTGSGGSVNGTAGTGGAGGQAIQRNGYTVTTSGAGTTYGAIS